MNILNTYELNAYKAHLENSIAFLTDSIRTFSNKCKSIDNLDPKDIDLRLKDNKSVLEALQNIEITFNYNIDLKKFIESHSFHLAQVHPSCDKEGNLIKKIFFVKTPLIDLFPFIPTSVDKPIVYPDILLGISALQGKRSTMEDTYFFQKFSDGCVAGVFDGHGGAQVAEKAKVIFEEDFKRYFQEANEEISLSANSSPFSASPRSSYSQEPCLETSSSEIYDETESETVDSTDNDNHSFGYHEKHPAIRTFQRIFDKVQVEVKKVTSWNSIGSTAVVSFVEYKTGMIYTATIGDSQAILYRSINQKRTSIPLSRIYNWSTKTEVDRAKKYLSQKEIESWGEKHPKKIRVGKTKLNLSRALGDFHSKGLISSEPTFTATKMQAGDIIILSSDGLSDYVSKLGMNLVMSQNPENPAQILSDLAMKNGSTDNVTVIAMKICEQNSF